METTMRSLMQVEKVDFFILQELTPRSIDVIMDAEFVNVANWRVVRGGNQCAIIYKTAWKIVNSSNPKAFPDNKDRDNPYRSWRTSLQVSVAAYTYCIGRYIHAYAHTHAHILYI